MHVDCSFSKEVKHVRFYTTSITFWRRSPENSLDWYCTTGRGVGLISLYASVMEVSKPMDRMKPTPIELDCEDGPLVEVTLQSLSGLTCHLSTPSPTNEAGRSIPSVTACVGFSGSAADMQVSSSFLCGTSGNIVVESQAAVLVHTDDLENQSTCSLVAEWHGNTGSVSSSRRSVSSSFSSQFSQQPHLTIRLPKRDPKLPSVPLSRMNRDCNVVYDGHGYPSSFQPPSLDESETSSQTPGVAEDKSDVRGASVVWSASGAAMPEIIELHVSLVMDADHLATFEEKDSHSSGTWKIPQHQTTYQVGVAYLVFFGSDFGTTVLDLPIKKQLAERSLLALRNHGVSLDDDSFLRVCVNVIADGQRLNTPSPQPLEPVACTNGVMTLEPILQQLRIAHDEHAREVRRQRHHQNDEPHHQNDEPAEDKRIEMEIDQHGSFFCSDYMGVLDMLKSFSGIIRHCDDGEGILLRSDSMGSTIVTSASLDI